MTAQGDLLDGFAILHRYGLGARIAGHLTHRHPTREAFWTHRFGLGFHEVGADDLMLADFGLNPLEGQGAINPTLHIHAEIYRARPDVHAIAHTHGVNVATLSATDAEFVPCSQMGGLFQDDILTVDEADLIVLDAAAGAAMAQALGPRAAVILRNHGCLVVGDGMPATVLRVLALEEACEVQLRAMATGRMQGMEATAARQVKSFVMRPEIVGAYWDYEVRQSRR